MQSQTKHEIFETLEKYHQILLKENTKTAPVKSHFFLSRVKYLEYIFEGNTITSLKFRIDAILKLQPPSYKTFRKAIFFK